MIYEKAIPSKKEIIKLAHISLEDEAFSEALYSKLANLYKSENLRSKFLKIAKMERLHADFWLSFLRKRGYEPILKVNRLKLALYVLLSNIVGLGLMLKMLESKERNAEETYSLMLRSDELSSEEKEMLKKILEDELVHEYEFADEESRFKDFIDHTRDAILGMNDGLVEILSVTTGLAGAYGNNIYVVLGGFIVGIAGALSMGLGTLVSVRAQKQVHEGVLRRVKLASTYVAHLFRDRIFSYMVKKGFSRETAEVIARESSNNQNLLPKIIAEEEHGLKEEKLEKPTKAGLYTGVFYMVGALIPLLPYLLGLPTPLAVAFSLILASIALAVSGFIVAVTADLSIKAKMVEMVIAGLGSAAATYSIGRLASMIIGMEIS